MPVTSARLAACYPRLYNVAEPQSWPSIRRHGLLSTTALLDLFGVRGKERIAFESMRRISSVTLVHPEHGTAVIRDQLPINEDQLGACLVGMDLRGWYEPLNCRVFFWPTERRLSTMLNAGSYRGREHVVLTIETAALLERHVGQVELSPINSGSTLYRPVPRGRGTFLALKAYPFEDRWTKYFRQGTVAELTVDRAVPDILDLALSVELRQGTEVLRTHHPAPV